ncbi:hypothetical protein M6B38_275800 [Iris pallida]|uniref:Uncharacterized protein n=1 Tax=Iris pallida TaxID=29817 RepID=A0AAX6I6Y5_IRIPA|nr:hypothetical protein M6B38_275800 [Iris pallida]
MFNSGNLLHEFWSGHGYLHDVYSVPSKLVPLCSFCFAELWVGLDHLIFIYFFHSFS